MRYCLLIICLLAASCATLVTARSDHITALAVTEDNATNGTIAQMYLEIRPGTGAVYIESFPLTKIDTQLSTRFAKEIACQKWNHDCDQYDFFYVIDTKSSVIGGPSAGGALTVLTYAVLADLPIDNRTAMTGTVMSGGIIGPVGGIRGKVAAAAGNGYTRVLIPAIETNDSGIPLADRYGIDIARIQTIDEAITYFTGVHLEGPTQPAQAPIEYTEQMRQVADSLCLHADVLADQLNNTRLVYANASEREATRNATISAAEARARAQNASDRGAYYTAASQCFAAATTYHRIALAHADADTIAHEEQQVISQHKQLTEGLAHTHIQTAADLEVAMIVTERLADATRVLNEAINESNHAAALAYAAERLETARAWMGLFGAIPSKELDFTPEQLARSCSAKIEEAQERVNYIAYVYPGGSDAADESLREAFADAQTHEYTLCLLHASQAKAEASALITAVQVPDADFTTVVEQKLLAAQEALVHQADTSTFPILGYSYAEYAQELLSQDKYSASLYTEYSLEFTQLDIYLPRKTRRLLFEPQLLALFGTGLLIGALSGLFIGYQLWKSSRIHRPKKVPIARNLPGKKR